MNDKEKLALAIKALHLINLPPHIGWKADVEREGYDTTGLPPNFHDTYLAAIASQALYKLGELPEPYKRWLEDQFPKLKGVEHETTA